jgi:4-alpha-glucanotransferase
MRLPRACGVLLHPTSLPGPHGCGDFGEAARRFVDWLVTAGQRIWQVLPLGGIGAGHSPYMSPSAFAGNPLLVDLADLQRRGWLRADETAPDVPFAVRRVDYATAVPWRMQRLALAAERFARSADAAARAQHDRFCDEQAWWLEDYALFMALSAAQPGRGWADWPEGLAQREPSALARARSRLVAELAAWRFVQWCFFRQWAELREYAHARGVRMFGDAPIFVAVDSADVWAHPALFELDAAGRPVAVAGVPPDYFSATGQRWGNPLYRWEAHAATGYDWWRKRVRHALDSFDLLRIDHFRGFAAYWRIPAHEPTAIRGEWMPGPGEALFLELTRSLGPLPIVAEDLGTITSDVERLRQAFAFPGMRVLQFAWGGDIGNPYLPHNHSPDSVIYTGTHDNDTTVGWWAGLDETIRRHVLDYLATDGREIHWDLVRSACASVADTAILPMQDLLGLDGRHRMNTPGEAAGCWEWRFEWPQVAAEPAQRLAALCMLHRRDGMPPPD